MSKQTSDMLNACIPFFTMFQDDKRQKILLMLAEDGGLTVSEITEGLPVSRTAVSYHLKLLLEAELVDVRSMGSERIYSLRLDNILAQLKEFIASLENDLRAIPEDKPAEEEKIFLMKNLHE